MLGVLPREGSELSMKWLKLLNCDRSVTDTTGGG